MVATPSPEAIAQLLEQLFRQSASLGFSHRLNPAQWAALRYFDKARPSARTVTAFAQFHATTKGTASKTISALVDKGLLERIRSSSDLRSSRLDLSRKGQALMKMDPLNPVTEAIASLDDGQKFALAECLDHLTRNVLRASDTSRAAE